MSHVGLEKETLSFCFHSFSLFSLKMQPSLADGSDGSRKTDYADVIESIAPCILQNRAAILATSTTIESDYRSTAHESGGSPQITQSSTLPEGSAAATTESKTPIQWKNMLGYDLSLGAMVTGPYQSLPAVTRYDIGKPIIFIVPSRLSLDWHANMDSSGSRHVQYALSDIDEHGALVLQDEEGHVTKEDRKFGKWVTYDSFASIRRDQKTPN